MSKTRITNLFLEAYQKSEIRQFLEGVGKYAEPLDQWVGAMIPTDITKIIPYGIYEAYRITNDFKIREDFELVLKDMIQSENIFELYWSTGIVYFQIHNQKQGRSPFSINEIFYTDLLKNEIRVNEKKLKEYKEWQGYNQENGVWNEITRFNSLLNKKYNLSILD